MICSQNLKKSSLSFRNSIITLPIQKLMFSLTFTPFQIKLHSLFYSDFSFTLIFFDLSIYFLFFPMSQPLFFIYTQSSVDLAGLALENQQCFSINNQDQPQIIIYSSLFMNKSLILCTFLLLQYSFVSANLLGSSEPSFFPFFSNAHLFRGNTQILVKNGDSNSMEYFIAFTECNHYSLHDNCYYGWVQNYTIPSHGKTVRGYPSADNSAQPIFRFESNSRSDYVINRHPDLSEEFVQLIQAGCELFQPTLHKISSFARPVQGSEYVFIPVGQYERTKPATTLQTDQFQLISDWDQKEERVATLEKQIDLEDIKTKRSNYREKVVVDSNFLVKDRLKVYDMIIPISDQGDFTSEVRLKLSKTDTISADPNKLSSYLKLIEREKTKIKYTSIQINEGRRSTIKYNDPLRAKQVILIKENGQFVVQQVDGYIDQNGELIQKNELGQLRKRLLSQVIFSAGKKLFSKTIFDKEFSIEMTVQAILHSQTQIQIKGTALFNLFVTSTSLQMFSFKTDQLNYQNSVSFSQTWPISFQVGVPTPLKLISLTLSFSVIASFQISLNTISNPIGPNTVSVKASLNIHETTQTNIRTQIKAVAVIGGAFLNGVICQVNSSPWFSFDLDTISNQASNLNRGCPVTISTNFKWGTFWKFWRPLKGWSNQMIINEQPNQSSFTTSFC